MTAKVKPIKMGRLEPY